LPSAVTPALVSDRVALSISLLSAVMTGASFLPVMVTVTSAVSVPPWPSSSVMVETSFTVWSSPRKSSLPSTME
jgi:hypothetical protein